jgi:hypothetical protein
VVWEAWHRELSPYPINGRSQSPGHAIDVLNRQVELVFVALGLPLRSAAWLVNDKRVERICRREGLKVPTRQSKRGRLWLSDGSCCGYGRSALITCGPTTLSRTARMTTGNFAAQHH